MSDDKLRQAKKLIQQGRYHIAVDILRGVDDPRARAWIEKLQTMTVKQKRQGPDMRIWLWVAGLSIAVLIFIASAIFGPRFVERFNEERIEAIYELEDTGLFFDEEDYLTVISYCSSIVTYGSETCMDWTELMLREYADVTQFCFGQADVDTEEGRWIIGECLQRNNAPPVF